jgi:DNA polymerase-4
MGPDFVARLEVGRFHGVGPATEAKMKALGIHTGADLCRCTEPFLVQQFGKSGAHFFKIARGIDHRPVTPDRPRKSAGSETTFARDLSDREDIEGALSALIEDVWSWRERSGIGGRTVTLKVRYADFEQFTRSRTLPHQIESRAELMEITGMLTADLFPLPKAIRLLGVSMSNFESADDRASSQMMFAF